MPHYHPPAQFPGMAQLPDPLRQLIETIFPPDSLPVPMSVGMKPGSAGPFRKAADLQGMLPPKQVIPPRPPTEQHVERAFSSYGDALKDLLLKRQE